MSRNAPAFFLPRQSADAASCTPQPVKQDRSGSGYHGRAARQCPRLLPWLAALAALAVYLLTLTPGLCWGDSAEMTGAAYQCGVPHCTGYPLYMLLAWPLLHLGPLASVPYRMNLLSALFGALATGLLAMLLHQLRVRRVPAAAGALVFAFSLTFWSQAVVTEVYTLHIALTGAVLCCAAAWDRTGEAAWLRRAAFCYGLCFTHHLMSVFLAPALLALALTSPHRARIWRELPRCAVLFLAPLALYAWLPLAAHSRADITEGDPRTWRNLLDHVTGAQFRGMMLDFSTGHLLSSWAHWTHWPAQGEEGLLWQQFPLPLWAAVPFGVVRLARRRPRWLLVTGLLFVTTVIYALGYRILDIEAYYLPAVLALAIWMGAGYQEILCLGARWRGRAGACRTRWTRQVAAGCLCLCPLTVLAANWRANDQSHDESARKYAAAVLSTLKPNALLVVGGGMDYNPTEYLHFVEHYRPDVDIVNSADMMHPEWLRLTTRRASARLQVRVPTGFPHGVRGRVVGNGLLRQVVLDNLPHRPVYLYCLCSPEELLRDSPVSSELRGLYGRGTTNLTYVELYNAPPAFTRITLPELQRGAVFAVGQAGRKEQPVAEFLGFACERRAAGSAAWYHVRYNWRVWNQALARRVQLRVRAVDDGGQGLREFDDHFPGTHSLHYLGQGVGPRQQPLPNLFAEEFDLYVPPQLQDATIRLIARLQLDGTPLKISGGNETVLQVGTLQRGRK